MIQVRKAYLTDDSEDDRSCILTLLVSINNSLKTCNRLWLTCIDGCRNGLSCLGCNIQNLSTSLQSTIIIISTYTIIFEMSKALTIVALYYQVRSCIGTSNLCTFGIDRNNLYRISTSLQTENICTIVRFILTNQLSINLLAIYIYIIRRSTLEWSPLQVGRLLPALCLSNLNHTCRIVNITTFALIGLLSKADGLNRSIVLITLCTRLRSNDGLVTFELHTCQVGSIIILHITSIGGNIHLIDLAVTSNGIGNLVGRTRSNGRSATYSLNLDAIDIHTTTIGFQHDITISCYSSNVGNLIFCRSTKRTRNRSQVSSI